LNSQKEKGIIFLPEALKAASETCMPSFMDWAIKNRSIDCLKCIKNMNDEQLLRVMQTQDSNMIAVFVSDFWRELHVLARKENNNLTLELIRAHVNTLPVNFGLIHELVFNGCQDLLDVVLKKHSLLSHSCAFSLDDNIAYSNETLLSLAITNGDVTSTRLLLIHGAKIENDNDVKDGYNDSYEFDWDYQGLEELLANPDSIQELGYIESNSNLAKAVRSGSLVMVELLLEHHPNQDVIQHALDDVLNAEKSLSTATQSVLASIRTVLEESLSNLQSGFKM